MWTYPPHLYRQHLERLLQSSGNLLGFFCDCGTGQWREAVREAAGPESLSFTINFFLEVALREGVRCYDPAGVEWYETVFPHRVRVRRHHAEIPVFPHVLLYGAEWDERALRQLELGIEALVPSWVRAYDQTRGRGKGLSIVRKLGRNRELNSFAYYRELREVVPRLVEGLARVEAGAR